jgi:C4-dicarboxylate transporter DctM subunit
MACVITATAIGTDLFESVNKWLSRVPGGLIISTIVAQAALGAAMASSLTTMLTVGKAALPEMERRNYNRRLCLGALACAGPLGTLIPPSGMAIIYALFSQVSVGKLFMAGIIPGIILTIMLCFYTIVICSIRPDLAPRPAGVNWKDRLLSTRKIWPIALLMFSIIGGIYFGIVTPTESAGVGCIIALIIAISLFHLKFRDFYRVILDAALTTGIMALLFVGANTFSTVLIVARVPLYLANFLDSLAISPWVIMVLINLLLLVMGCFMEPMTIIMVILPVLVPLLDSLGFNLIHFGIIMTVNMEIGLLTPPVGMALFTMQGVFNISYGELVRSVVPYVIILIIFLGIIVAFPELSLWLPGTMR